MSASCGCTWATASPWCWIHWRWGLMGEGVSASDTLDASRLIRVVIPNLPFTDGTGTHVETPPPGETTFTFDLGGHTPDDVTDLGVSARDLFGNEYETRYRLR